MDLACQAAHNLFVHWRDANVFKTMNASRRAHHRGISAVAEPAVAENFS